YASFKPWGAVVSDKASVYSGPNKVSHSVLFVLHEGAPLRVLDAEKAWYRIALADGKKGRVSKDLVGAVARSPLGSRHQEYQQSGYCWRSNDIDRIPSMPIEVLKTTNRVGAET